MKSFEKLFDKVTAHTEMPILRPVDLMVLHDHIMETDLFSDVIALNICEDMTKTKAAIMIPGEHSFNRVVNINSIYKVPTVDGKTAWMVNCKEKTVI
jgi:hypothetical protein